MLVFPIIVNAILAVTGASNTLPIVITTAVVHHYETGEEVTIADANGNNNANGTHTITVLSDTTFELDGIAGNGDLNPAATPTCTQASDPERDYLASDDFVGSVHALGGFDQSDKCNLVVSANQDPQLVNKELQVRLYGRPQSESEWVIVATIDDLSGWTTITDWVFTQVDLRVYPEMAIAITNAFPSSTTRLRAWLIV